MCSKHNTMYTYSLKSATVRKSPQCYKTLSHVHIVGSLQYPGEASLTLVKLRDCFSSPRDTPMSHDCVLGENVITRFSTTLEYCWSSLVDPLSVFDDTSPVFWHESFGGTSPLDIWFSSREIGIYLVLNRLPSSRKPFDGRALVP